MIEKFIIGTKFTKTMVVTENDLASKWGSGKAKVYATPCMIAFMELTATELSEQFLDDGYITVGTSVDIKHRKASFVGETITCNATLIEKFENGALMFDVECFSNEILIGNGKHGRFIVNKEKFEREY